MDQVDIEGDDEIIFNGKYIRTSLWLAKKFKDMNEDAVPIIVEFDNVAIGITLEQFEELFNAVSQTKTAIEKRKMFE